MKLAFALLAHGEPSLVERVIRLLAAQGHKIAVHYDRKSSDRDYEQLVEAFRGSDAVRFARRARVGWGQWGVVQGALNCLQEIDEAGWNPDYVYHLSGMDYPIKSSGHLVDFLKRNYGDEFIESVPADTEQWVKTGPQRERYQYRWYFNWRAHPWLTDWAFALQKAAGLKRSFLHGMTPYIGSQWWALTWSTLKKIMEMAKRPDIIRFFKTTLVPDELFFQTLIRHVAPDAPITNCSLTLYQFTDYGFPVVYYKDHLEYLIDQPFFMARKLSPHDSGLRDALDSYWTGQMRAEPFDDMSVGIVGPEYQQKRRTNRDGVPGVPVIGVRRDYRCGNLDRLMQPFFVILGTSSAELRMVQRAVAGHPELLCHGELFHPERIEFAAGRRDFAGYAATNIEIRDVARAEFLADIMRAERRRMSGFLVRWGHGAHIPAALFDLANVRIIVLRGDPELTFFETLAERGASMRAMDAPACGVEAPPLFRRKFQYFLENFRRQAEAIEARRSRRPQGVPATWRAAIEITDNPNHWLGTLETSLDIAFGGADDDAERIVQADTYGRLELLRAN